MRLRPYQGIHRGLLTLDEDHIEDAVLPRARGGSGSGLNRCWDVRGSYIVAGHVMYANASSEHHLESCHGATRKLNARLRLNQENWRSNVLTASLLPLRSGRSGAWAHSPRLLGRSASLRIGESGCYSAAFRPGARACPGLPLPRGRSRSERLSPPLPAFRHRTGFSRSGRNANDQPSNGVCTGVGHSSPLAQRALRRARSGLLPVLPLPLANLCGLLVRGEPVQEDSLPSL